MRLIEKAWYENHPLKWLLLPLNLLFWTISASRRACYRLGIFQQPKLPVPIVIVGNIGVGGNGKTPLVIYLVEQLQARNIKVGVISRGYGGEPQKTPLLLTDNTTTTQAGDEPVLIYQRTKAPVVVSSDRVASVETLIKQGCHMVISDDGLQHYRLKRDVELIVVDGKRRFGNGWLMPAGPLREGLWRLKTVDQVIINSGLADVNEDRMSIVGQRVINLKSQQSLPIETFLSDVVKTGKVNAFAGIGNPERFFTTLTELKIPLDQRVGFVDHHHYQVSDLEQFESNIPLLMTEKDAVKCTDLVKDNAWYLPVDAHFEEQKGEQLIELIITRTKSYGL